MTELRKHYLTDEDTGRTAALDDATDAIITVDYAHHEVHGGSHFVYSETSSDLDAAAVIEVRAAAHNSTKWAHIVPFVSGALHTKLEIFENCTHTAGAALTSYNSNRNSGTTPLLSLARSADDNADGTLIFSTEFGIDTGLGVNRATGGGGSRGDSEWILDQGAIYLFRVTSLTADNVVSLALEWYEHTDKV